MRPGAYLSTVVVPAASYNLVDLASLKLRLAVTTTASDAYFNLAIADASFAARRFMNNPIAVETLQDAIYPWRDGWLGALRDRRDTLQLKRWPLTTTPSLAGTAPPQAPVLSAVASAGAAASSWYVRLTYVTATGETAASLETTLACAANFTVQIAAPGADPLGLATGYNVYVAASAFAEVRQTASPVAVTSPYTLTNFAAGGASPPNALTLVETHADKIVPLAEGVDFLADPTLGQVTRLDRNGRPRAWCEAPVTAIYSAGYATTPNDLQDAVSEMVKARWYAQTRDPQIRERNVEGVMQTTYWFGTGPGGDTDMPPSIQAKLERYRVPVLT
jgi:hypothetical protein